MHVILLRFKICVCACVYAPSLPVSFNSAQVPGSCIGIIEGIYVRKESGAKVGLSVSTRLEVCTECCQLVLLVSLSR